MLLIMGHGRRHILWFGVTAHPTAEWIANHVTEACGWKQAPRYLIRDRDAAYGDVFYFANRTIPIRRQIGRFCGDFRPLNSWILVSAGVRAFE
jgi:hypothetical protein